MAAAEVLIEQDRMTTCHINILFVSKVELRGIISNNGKETSMNYIIIKSIFLAEQWLIINSSLKCVQSIKIGPCPRALSTLNALRFLRAAFRSTLLFSDACKF